MKNRSLIKILILMVGLTVFVQAQAKSDAKFPNKIRGYKVYKAKTLVLAARDEPAAAPKKGFDSVVKVGTPQNFKLSFDGATFELPLSMSVQKTAGRVDLIAFEDMRVNGIKMQVEEYKQPFEFQKGVHTDLPQPLKVSITMDQDSDTLMKFNPSLTEFEITGKVYVFGAFKKFGMTFKRVIPTEFKFKTKFMLPLMN